MNARRMRWLGAILLMTLIAVVVGMGAYRMGMTQGLALGMALVESGGDAIHPHAFHAHGWYGWPGPGPWGFGFGFGFIVPLLFLFAAFAAVRMLIWRGPRGPWRGGWGGPWHRHHHHRRRWRDFDRDYAWDDDRDDGRRRSFDDDWHRRGRTL